ncbi:hypothetical protein [Anabaena sp. 4-3]|uniref:hypothetical protein n=1 Tax=Anabaena sp. 4-3 TaxID=1811979 RepID=UPI00082A0606|nr:hypothetical protein [Anabaena sp. 4-3]
MSWDKIKIYKSYLLGCLGASIAILIGIQLKASAQYFSGITPIEIYQLAIPQKLTIPPINPSEIAITSRSDTVKHSGDLSAPPPFNTSIVREYPNIWQIRVPVDEVDSLYATYELKAENGKDNAVTNEQRSDAALPIVIEPLPIVEISRDTDSNTALVQGGFRLTIDIANTPIAGNYAGELTVKVDRR